MLIFFRILIYITIYLTLIAPSLPLVEMAIGPIHIYIYEIPLALLFFLSVIQIFMTGNVHKSKYLHLLGLMLFLLLLAFFVGRMYQYKPATIIGGLRPYVYYLSGGFVLIYGKGLVKIKHIFIIIILGLLTQGIWGVYFFLTNTLEIYFTGMRLPFRSSYLVPFVTFTVMFIFQNKKSGAGFFEKYFYIISTAILIVFMILCMNRTVWIAMFLMMMYYLYKYFSISRLFKTVIISTIFISFFLIILSYSRYGQLAQKYLEDRFFKYTVGNEAVSSVWRNNRDRIFKNALNAFIKHPILGTGAGYTYSWKVHKMWSEDKLIEKNITSTDTSVINITVRNGPIGFVIFWYFLIAVWKELKVYVNNIENKSNIEGIIIKGVYFYFPFLILISFNISILFGYPAVIIFSLIFAQVFLYNEEKFRM